MTATAVTHGASAAHGFVRQRRRIGRIVQYLCIAIGLVWTLVPIYWMLSTSLKNELEASLLHPTLIPRDPTLQNYVGLAGGSLPFLRFFVNSVGSCLLAAVVAVVIAIPAAYALSRRRFRLAREAGTMVLVVRMFPMVVLLAPLYLMLLNTGTLDTLFGLVVGYTTFGLPFAVWMIKGFIDAVPIEIEEAARVDGYPRWQVLLRIVVPLIYPGLITTGIFVLMEAWNNLIYPLTFITSLEKQTLPAALVLTFTGQFKTDWGGMMAASTITTLPLMIAFFAVQRSMVRGLTAGSVTGT
ncbi:carbohydrate ABC transporter permease [Aurantimonas sp. VKM B-3413]|uniref:carbohydrate ABC transporter permease n=1 Tax=Aurantimonas sp. VKM B-3413 TaxID=2779401 RepID=UPI001E4DEBB5|nr:carbohydrate ABC transporter permease [Aurantimonas sp. VKM B-3413]MCB8840478.1 carbohydrate ABC transporter permease [Aurantimonas sp. VKM B-3413]